MIDSQWIQKWSIYPRQTLFQTIYYFCFDLFHQIGCKHRENPNRIFRVSFEPLPFLILLTVPPFQFFLFLSFDHPLKNLHRITFGSRSLLFGRTRENDRITRVYLCIQSTFHFVGPPIFFLFTLFSSPLPHSLTISRTRDRSLGGRRNVGCYSRKILWVRYRRLR